MYLASLWKDFAVLDAGNGNKLERWGEYTLLRPDPQAVWTMPDHDADAVYIRSDKGGGYWSFMRDLPDKWTISYRDLRFVVRPTGFKHTGLFPEQSVNWDKMRSLIEPEAQSRPVKILNLFGYTGGATCACLKAGAQVVHVDAAKGMLSWARDNAAENGLSNAPVRYIADDCMKFVQREKRRGNTYDGILMDPPSYGRGPSGEMWKIENDLYPLVLACAELLSEKPLFFLINSYTTGLAPTVLSNVLTTALLNGRVEAGEVCLPIERDKLVLPCGSSGWWTP
ncbi:MAG TPA: class I SAM-dependent methyltransferase [Eubacteriales bacterium]|nr:class I SAM-dependent methyltransferase [Clostridia bacterium]HRV72802.1 class I SAM-dependent methyltransferase [Eubacteriales bacterium]